jgi:hypothetical protein
VAALRHVFSTGGGVIYGVAPDGRLWWYRHNAYLTGGGLETPGAWEVRAVVGHGWGDFSEVFALLPGTPDMAAMHVQSCSNSFGRSTR